MSESWRSHTGVIGGVFFVIKTYSNRILIIMNGLNTYEDVSDRALNLNKMST